MRLVIFSYIKRIHVNYSITFLKDTAGNSMNIIYARNMYETNLLHSIVCVDIHVHTFREHFLLLSLSPSFSVMYYHNHPSIVSLSVCILVTRSVNRRVSSTVYRLVLSSVYQLVASFVNRLVSSSVYRKVLNAGS